MADIRKDMIVKKGVMRDEQLVYLQQEAPIPHILGTIDQEDITLRMGGELVGDIRVKIKVTQATEGTEK